MKKNRLMVKFQSIEKMDKLKECEMPRICGTCPKPPNGLLVPVCDTHDKDTFNLMKRKLDESQKCHYCDSPAVIYHKKFKENI